MTTLNTQPGNAARGLRRAFLQAASGLLTARARRRSADRVRARPRLEGLEDRCLLSLTITEFPVPTANAASLRDHGGPRRQPLVHREGTGNTIGMINPTTHAITEFPIPTASSSPRRDHGGPRRQPLVHRVQRPTRSG